VASASSRRKRKRRTSVASSGSTEASPRSFTLPNSVETENVQATYDKGVLEIRLAKKAEARPKQIKVKVGGERTLEAKVHGKAA